MNDDSASLRRFSRRDALILGGGTLAVSVLGSTLSKSLATTSSLARIARRKGLLFGTAISAGNLNRAFADVAVEQSDVLTPENELKLWAIRGAAPGPDYKRGDGMVDFARKHGKVVHGHTLVWNSHVPDWVKQLAQPRFEELFESHITTTVQRYARDVKRWDVVNEPISTDPDEKNWLRSGPFLDRLGRDYIARAFRLARTAMPNAELILNETHTERDDAFGLMYRRRLLRLIDELQNADVPLDAIGLQGHLISGKPFEPDEFTRFLEEIEKRKLAVHISELDVNDEAFPDDIRERDRRVADMYRVFLKGALPCQSLNTVITWQLCDTAGYQYNMSKKKDPLARRRPRALLFDEMLKPKAAFHAVAEAFDAMPDRA